MGACSDNLVCGNVSVKLPEVSVKVYKIPRVE
jgi:hypothetical protein